jgi:hypothetical protein
MWGGNFGGLCNCPLPRSMEFSKSHPPYNWKRAVPDDSQIRSLEDWDYYVRLNRRVTHLKKYWQWLAMGPFAVVLFIGLKFFGSSVNKTVNQMFDVLLMISLAWAMLVAGYGLTNLARWFAVRCPRCGWRFGLRNQCGSCGLPRHLPAGLKATLEGSQPKALTRNT